MQDFCFSTYTRSSLEMSFRMDPAAFRTADAFDKLVGKQFACYSIVRFPVVGGLGSDPARGGNAEAQEASTYEQHRTILIKSFCSSGFTITAILIHMDGGLPDASQCESVGSSVGTVATLHYVV
jgi:hypothetical protein